MPIIIRNLSKMNDSNIKYGHYTYDVDKANTDLQKIGFNVFYLESINSKIKNDFNELLNYIEDENINMEIKNTINEIHELEENIKKSIISAKENLDARKNDVMSNYKNTSGGLENIYE